MNITFPDGSIRSYDAGITAIEVAENISPRLAAEVCSATIGGALCDLRTPLNADASIKFHKFDEPEGKHAFWHSSAHLMAEALQQLYPTVKFGTGPALEQGFYYDVDLESPVAEADLAAIEQKMLDLARQAQLFDRQQVSKQEALDLFKQKGEVYKCELIADLQDGTISTYTNGTFTDLCKGPHVMNTSVIKVVKLTSIAGAYWRNNEKNKMLTRIYGITFPKQSMLEEYLTMLEEARKRDHRKIGKEQELFTFSEKVGSGLPLWLPKGTALRMRLEDFMRNVQKRYGYEQVMTPHIGQKELYETSGHYEKYKESSFKPIETPNSRDESGKLRENGEIFMLKPMNCPHHCEIYKWKQRSYKELPVRLAEFGTVYRYEQSGELHGLTRVRGFTQDDAHIFCTPDQIKDEFKKVIDIIMYIFGLFEFKDFTAQISLRDKDNRTKYIGSDDNWDKAERAIIEATQEKGMATTVEYGEAAFYGPKLDFMVKDAIGRKWQLGTIQVDYNLPERFALEYVAADNRRQRPVMIHRAPFGSMERFVAMLIEHTAGKFPLWLTPTQAVVLPISEKYHEYAHKVVAALETLGVRTTIDERNEKIGKKIRDNELQHIPYLLLVGEKEEAADTVAVRRQGEGDKGEMKIEEFVNAVNQEVTAIINQ
jgi:threonyl-tRNA synthetase